MSNQSLSTSRLLRPALILLALLALLSLTRTLSNAFGPAGGLDFHSYWYFGHFVRQGNNPYQVYAEGAPLRYPLRYLDGVTLDGPPFAQDGLAITPANTAPMLLTLTPLAFFSWPVARAIWLAVNLLTAALIPWLLLRLFPPARRPEGAAALLIPFAFYAFQSTRVATWIGQTTLFVFFLMLLAYHRRQAPLPAGLLLGLALAKYSLSLPVALIFLLEKRWSALIVAALVQLGGLLAVTALGSYTFLETLAVYAGLLARHAREPGIHLASIVPGGDAVAVGLGVTLSAVVFLFWRRRGGTGGVLLLAIATLWSLLVAYHRAYDALAAILFLLVAVSLWQKRAAWGISNREAKVAGWSAAGAILLLILPGEIVGRILPLSLVTTWLALGNALVTIGLLAMLLLLLRWAGTAGGPTAMEAAI